MRKHKAQLVDAMIAGDLKFTPGLLCLSSKKAVGALPSKLMPTTAHLLEALDMSCRGKGDADLGLHELVTNAV